jgi:hypothetical protein
MGPFNIKVGYGENQVTLTILPEDKKQFKVIYYGAVLGAVRLDDLGCWEQVPEEEVIVGDLPPYEPDLRDDRLEFVLDDITADAVGEEIANYSYNPDPTGGPVIDPIR